MGFSQIWMAGNESPVCNKFFCVHIKSFFLRFLEADSRHPLEHGS